MTSAARTVHAVISGRVHGVGYRAWTEDAAAALKLRGWVRNRKDGTVEAVFSGSGQAVEQIIKACHHGPPAAQVSSVIVSDWPEDGLPAAFEFRPTL